MGRLMGSKSISMEKEDWWVWKESETTEYTVNSTYIILKDDEQGEVVAMYEGFWRIKAQPSAHLTAWRVLEDKITTKSNLVKRGISVENNICSMCGEEKETMSRLFCTCRVAWLVWSKCYEWVGVASTVHREPKKHFAQFRMTN